MVGSYFAVMPLSGLSPSGIINLSSITHKTGRDFYPEITVNAEEKVPFGVIGNLGFFPDRLVDVRRTGHYDTHVGKSSLERPPQFHRNVQGQGLFVRIGSAGSRVPASMAGVYDDRIDPVPGLFNSMGRTAAVVDGAGVVGGAVVKGRNGQ
jgi:hypothetical protein